jgi:hypothetical protein
MGRLGYAAAHSVWRDAADGGSRKPWVLSVAVACRVLNCAAKDGILQGG